MHSIVMTTIFYGYGLSLYAEVPRLWQQAFVLALVTLQLLISPWWLKRFNFGPVEWLWRLPDLWAKAAHAPIDVYTLALACVAATTFKKIKKPGERT